jgi:DNA repair exonuclease SbcCD ATPase subunit
MRWTKTQLSRAFQAWYANTVGRPKFSGFERAARYLKSAGLGRAFANWRRITKAMSKKDAMLDKLNSRFSTETMSLMEQLQAALRRIAELEEAMRNQVPQKNLDDELDAAERARKRAEMELEAARKRLQELLSNGDASAEDLARAMREVQGLEDELARANTLIEKLRARIRELEDELARLRAELAKNMADSQKANDEWLSAQARRQAEEAAARRRQLEEERERQRLMDEEAARRRALLKQQGDDDEQNKMRHMLSHWLNRSLSLAMNRWRDEAAFLRRIEMIMKRVALRWKKDKAYKLLVKLRDYAEAKRIKDLEFQAYLTKTKTPTSRARASSRSTYVSPFNSPKHTKSSV